MKTLLIFFTLFLFLSLPLQMNAQISIGPKAGINIAKFIGDDVPKDDTKSVIGLQFGAVFEIPINEMFAIQTEFLYFQKGSRNQTDIEDETFDILFNCIEAPILAKIKFGPEDGPKFFATLGPSFGYGMDITVKTEGEKEKFSFDEAEIFERFDLSLSMGAGAQFAVGPGSLFLDVRYLLGLTSIDDFGRKSDTRNGGLGISLGYLFPLGAK